MLTPYERVCTAWFSEDRPRQLNAVVEVMASEGLTRDAIDAALTELLLRVRAEGADEATEELIMGVSDRLHGWCHRSFWIETRGNAPASPPAKCLDSVQPTVAQ